MDNQGNLPRTLSDIELDKYFLGNRSIKTKQVTHLLISTSFGANAILYAAWLGYSMGMWAVLIQIAWCLSFVLLSKFADKVYKYTSLHDFLGEKFGKWAKIISALCSVIGLLYFMGWEISFAQSGLESLPFSNVNWGLVIGIFIVIAIIYTSINGRKLVSMIDTGLNIVKFLLLIFIVVALGINLGTHGELSFDVVIPPFSVAIANLGILGLITNLVFNLSWQFVDNSSWQSISSNSSEDKTSAKKSLFGASGGVFLTVALLGTILGAFLRAKTGLDSDNILSAVTIGMNGTLANMVNISIVALLLFSMISLIDGTTLSVVQSIISDIGLFRKNIDEKPFKLNIARIITVLMGFIAAWGVRVFITALGGSIFDFVYVFIVLQLSLLGSIIVGLMSKKATIKYMSLSIILALILGFGLSIIGTIMGKTELIDVAGTVAAILSIIIAIIINNITYKVKGKEE